MKNFKPLDTSLPFPVLAEEVGYERKFKRKSHKCRKHVKLEGGDKTLPCLEWGNAGIVFQLILSRDNLSLVEYWWEEEYALKQESFNVELFTDTEKQLLEIRFMSEKCYYISNRKRFESVLYDSEAIVSEYYNSLPKAIQELVELCYLSDFDYLDYGEESFEEV